MDIKVLMLVDHPLKNDVRVEKEAQTLTKEGYEVEILSVHDKNLPDKEDRDGYTINRIIDPIIIRPLSEAYRAFEKKFVEFLIDSKYDILHCHDFRMIIIGAKVKQKKPSLILIYDAHEYLAGWPFYQDSTLFSNRLKGYFVWKWLVKEEKKAIKMTDAIITVSQSLTEEIQDHFSLTTLPVLLRNVPDAFHLHKEKYFHQYFNIPASDKVFVFSGGLRAGSPSYNWKSLINIIKAIDSYENCCIVFIGDSDRHPILKEKIQKLSLQKKVYFHKKVSPFEAGYLISSADIAIVNIWQPDWKSYLFSLSNRVLEFSMAGLPIMCCKLPEYDKLNNEYQHMVFTDFEKLPEIKKSIDQLISQYEKLKANALKIKETMYWEMESKNLTELYNHFITSNITNP